MGKESIIVVQTRQSTVYCAKGIGKICLEMALMYHWQKSNVGNSTFSRIFEGFVLIIFLLLHAW